ncbi:MAG: glycosyltransferase [Alphaproteobacteria bacterium]|nr:glycosyltransferase [Alphaproteobacteria bacterium]
MVRQIRAAGHRVSFLYSIQESCTNKDNTDTLREVDAFYLHMYDHAIREAETARALMRVSLERAGLNYELDSWYQADLDDLIRTIYERDPFDVMLGNYIWMSKAFDAVPDTVIKIQQTHDMMSDRMMRLARQGMPPSFFSVTPADEGRGLDRADINIALQCGEEIYFRGLTDKIVRTLQHAPCDIPFAPRPLPAGRKLRVGFIGSDNAVNVRTATLLVDALVRMTSVSSQIDLCIAGNICTAFRGVAPPFIKLLGACDNLGDIYRAMDVMVNPVEDGTGLKIKSVEALQYHIPIVMTAAGSEGLLSPYHFHRCASVTEVVGYLKMIAENPRLLTLMQSAGDKVLHAYRDRLARAADALISPQTVIDAQRARTAATRQAVCGDRVLQFYQPENAVALRLPVADGVTELAARIPEESVWLDIGSRSGEFALFVAATGRARKVIAIEWDPDFIEQLKLNVLRNKMQDIVDMRFLGYAPDAAPGYGVLRPASGRSKAVFDESDGVTPGATVPFAPLAQLIGGDMCVNAVNIDTVEPVETLAAIRGVIEKYAPLLFIRADAAEAETVRRWAQENGCDVDTAGDGVTVVLTPVSRRPDAEIVNIA